jgi:hypothetical protein
MKTIDEMLIAEKAWLLLTKMEEVKYLLYECYNEEFDRIEKTKDNSFENGNDDLPF